MKEEDEATATDLSEKDLSNMPDGELTAMTDGSQGFSVDFRKSREHHQ